MSSLKFLFSKKSIQSKKRISFYWRCRTINCGSWIICTNHGKNQVLHIQFFRFRKNDIVHLVVQRLSIRCSSRKIMKCTVLWSINETIAFIIEQKLIFRVCDVADDIIQTVELVTWKCLTILIFHHFGQRIVKYVISIYRWKIYLNEVFIDIEIIPFRDNMISNM